VRQHRVGVQRDHRNAFAFSLLDAGGQRRGINRLQNDRVVALVDEVIHHGDLGFGLHLGVKRLQRGGLALECVFSADAPGLRQCLAHGARQIADLVRRLCLNRSGCQRQRCDQAGNPLCFCHFYSPRKVPF